MPRAEVPGRDQVSPGTTGESLVRVCAEGARVCVGQSGCVYFPSCPLKPQVPSLRRDDINGFSYPWFDRGRNPSLGHSFYRRHLAVPGRE